VQLTNSRSITIPRNLGSLMLSGWLIAVGVVPLLNLGNPLFSALLHLTAIATGVVLLWERRHG